MHEVAAILIVEDEAIIALGASTVLEDEGHNVILAPDGEAGLAKVRSVQPDLIIADYMMPRMDGLTMVRALREEGVTTPVLLATSASEEALLENPHKLYDGYLRKPYLEAELLQAVRSLLGNDDES